MKEYIVKRVFLAVVTIFVISAITFFAMNLIPGGPFNTEKALSPAVQKTLEERYNLDKPVYVQFGMYLKNLMHGDWGVSLKSGRDIWTDMWSKFQISAKLGGMAAIVAIIVGIVLGSIAALNRNKLARPCHYFLYDTGNGNAVFRIGNPAAVSILFTVGMGSGLVIE